MTCSMAWRMATLPDMAAICRGVDPAGAATSDMMSRSTVRTIMEAPLSSSRRTHSRLPLKAAKWRAVRPFSALLSMYLQAHKTYLQLQGTTLHSTSSACWAKWRAYELYEPFRTSGLACMEERIVTMLVGLGASRGSPTQPAHQFTSEEMATLQTRSGSRKGGGGVKPAKAEEYYPLPVCRLVSRA